MTGRGADGPAATGTLQGMHPFARWSLTAFGLGRLPASGTWGSLPPVVAAGILTWQGAGTVITETSLILLALWGSIACVRFGSEAERCLGRKDPGLVVADEVAGMAIMLLWLPDAPTTVAGVQVPWWGPLAAAFLLFRFLDIVKLPPARGLQSLSGGWGILIDDLVAAAQGWLLLQVAFRLALPSLAGG